MSQIHQAFILYSSGEWRKLIKMEKSELSLNIYVQYVEDFKFWVMAAGWLIVSRRKKYSNNGSG